MTGEELIEILGEHLEDTAGMNEAVHYILAALAKEREGDVVLVNGEITKASIPGFYHLNGMYAFKSTELEGHVGKRGSLIFRPAKEGA